MAPCIWLIDRTLSGLTVERLADDIQICASLPLDTAGAVEIMGYVDASHGAAGMALR